MDESRIVADRFDDIVKRCDPLGYPTGLAHPERVLYFVVAVRCEADMNGFCSVFEQLLRWEDLEFFIESLRSLGQPELAATYEEIGALLLRAGYYPAAETHFHELPEEILEKFDALEKRARAGHILWSLDSDLAALLRSGDGSHR